MTDIFISLWCVDEVSLKSALLEELSEKEAESRELEEAELSLELEPEETEPLVGLEDEEAVDAALDDLLGGVEISHFDLSKCMCF